MVTLLGEMMTDLPSGFRACMSRLARGANVLLWHTPTARGSSAVTAASAVNLLIYLCKIMIYLGRQPTLGHPSLSSWESRN